MNYQVEEIITNPKRNEYGWFVTTGMVNGYVIVIRSDYRPTKAEATRMLAEKARRQDIC